MTSIAKTTSKMAPSADKCLRAGAAAINGKTGLDGVVSRHLNIPAGRIDRGHPSAKLCQGFRENTGAAPYIEDRQTIERLCRAPVALLPFARKVSGEQLAQIGQHGPG